MRIGIAGEAFGHGKKAVKSRFQLAGKAPVIHGRCQHDDIGFPVGGVDEPHIVLLHAGACGVLTALHTAQTAVDIQLVEVEPGHLMARAPGPALSITQHGRIAPCCGDFR